MHALCMAASQETALNYQQIKVKSTASEGVLHTQTHTL